VRGRGVKIMEPAQGGLGDVHALFQQRVDGDDALLKLAGLRFAQMGMAAELYANTPDQLEAVLQFVPPHAQAGPRHGEGIRRPLRRPRRRAGRP
jgi:hypothetical protein